ncbi:RrF2 family transcriptional regulator [Seohaeicola zhoushanensis]|uniref:Rrf2 family transcriptional regulator n=1 Tax=Seohaeicola zhoushanensis TaxID=1569283 RepID=A0A8J3H0W3_9RHOB|nr:Rrf2 family transcriptional regulator [Seohaeicola zhoushanensis]GHF61442.1 Rrf2 family transcriptional regulator [Seohaeicola zhoushanensis]
MQLRNQVEWVLHCCAILAMLPEGARLSTRALAEFHGVPKEYLSKALQSLAQVGIVEGSLGPAGGYRLARPASAISFLDIVEAVEGGGRSFACTEIRCNAPCHPPGFRPEGPCQVARIMWRADDAWRRELAAQSLSALADQLGRELPADLQSRTAGWLKKRISS